MKRSLPGNARFSSRRRGVTLVEMLVTLAVLLLIMTVIVQIFQAATGSLSSAQAYQELDNQLRRLDSTIRADLTGIVVVAGGPGTGKTAVALHRAAYLLYTHRFPLERQGVLVVGPNRLFMRYIEHVLPSLGESGVELSTIEQARSVAMLLTCTTVQGTASPASAETASALAASPKTSSVKPASR